MYERKKGAENTKNQLGPKTKVFKKSKKGAPRRKANNNVAPWGKHTGPGQKPAMSQTKGESSSARFPKAKTQLRRGCKWVDGSADPSVGKRVTQRFKKGLRSKPSAQPFYVAEQKPHGEPAPTKPEGYAPLTTTLNFEKEGRQGGNRRKESTQSTEAGVGRSNLPIPQFGKGVRGAGATNRQKARTLTMGRGRLREPNGRRDRKRPVTVASQLQQRAKARIDRLPRKKSSSQTRQQKSQ